MRLSAVLAIAFCGLLPRAADAAGKPSPSETDRLFAALSKASSEEEAKPIEERILTSFLQSGSPTVDLLMTRAAAALHGGDNDVARKLVASVTSIAPTYAEGWHQRAELQAEAGDDQGAMFCLERTVSLNPRQFAALTELGEKIEEYGDKTVALKLYRRALALDPHYDDLARKVRALEHMVEGETL